MERPAFGPTARSCIATAMLLIPVACDGEVADLSGEPEVDHRAGPTAGAVTTSVQFTTISTGQAIATPEALFIQGTVTDFDPARTYEVELSMPGGGTDIVAVDSNGDWGYPTPVPIQTFTNDAMLTFVAELRDITGPVARVRDRDIVNLVDQTPFLATISTRTTPQSDAFLVRVPATGIEAMNPAVPVVAESMGQSFDDALAAAFANPQAITQPEGCWLGANLGQQQWDEIAFPIAAVVGAFVGIPPAAVLASGELADRTQLCSTGVTAELVGFSTGPASADLEPVDNGLEGDVSVGALTADISLQTGLLFNIDLSGLGLPGPDQLNVQDPGIHLCDATYTADAGRLSTSLLVDGGSPPLEIDITEGPAGAMVFTNPQLAANGSCGWGIFDGLVADSQATIQDAIADGFRNAFAGQPSLMASVIDHAWSDAETSSRSPVVHLAGYEVVQTLAPIPPPAKDLGGFTFIAQTAADGDGTDATCNDAIYHQTPSLLELGSEAPGGLPFDFAAGVSTATLNQVLSGGAESEHMTFRARRSWLEWNLCHATSGSCDDEAILTGAVLADLHPAFAAMGTNQLAHLYDAELAPFVAMEPDPMQQQPDAFFFLGSYRTALVDTVTGTVWIEFTCGAEDEFDLQLGELDGRYDYGLPSGAACTLTSTALPIWPDDAAVATALDLMLAPMLDQAVAALHELQSPEVFVASAPGGLTTTNVATARGGAVFYSFHDLD